MKKLTLLLIISLLVISCSNKFTIIKRKYCNGFLIASSKKLTSKGELKNTDANLKKHETSVVKYPPINPETVNFVYHPRQNTKSINSQIDKLDEINPSFSEHECLSQNKSEIKLATTEKTSISEKRHLHLSKFKSRNKKGVLRELLSFFLLFYGYTMIAGCFIALIIFFIVMDPFLIIAALIQFILGKLLVGYGKKLGGY